MYNILITPKAQSDIEELVKWKSENTTRKSVDSAVNELINKLDEAILSLEKFPERFSITSRKGEEPLVRRGYRVINIDGGYRIYFVILDNATVEVRSAGHSNMNYLRILK